MLHVVECPRSFPEASRTATQVNVVVCQRERPLRSSPTPVNYYDGRFTVPRAMVSLLTLWYLSGGGIYRSISRGEQVGGGGGGYRSNCLWKIRRIDWKPRDKSTHVNRTGGGGKRGTFLLSRASAGSRRTILMPGKKSHGKFAIT